MYSDIPATATTTTTNWIVSFRAFDLCDLRSEKNGEQGEED